VLLDYLCIRFKNCIMNGDLLIQRFNTLPENLQLLVFGYVDFLFESYNKFIVKKENTENEEITQELKDLLDERIANYEKNPHKIKTWEEIEERLLKKYKYAV
jgi:hypothetical protein